VNVVVAPEPEPEEPEEPEVLEPEFPPDRNDPTQLPAR
jgi:hypothetical protein